MGAAKDTLTITVPTLGESITEATLARWLKQEGDHVEADALLAEIETEKITLEITAPTAGIVRKHHVLEDATVKVGDTLVTFESGQSQTSKKAVETPLKKKKDAPLSPPKNGTVTSTGTPLKQTKETYLETLTSGSLSHPAPPRTVFLKQEERVPMSRLRQKIAQQMKAAQNNAAILTTFNEIDMSAVMALRARQKEAFERKHGVRLGMMSFFVQAAVSALQIYPTLNAELEDQEIVFKNYYNIGVAVGTERGLVVPTLKHAEHMTIAEIERTIAAFAEKAKTKQLLPKDLMDGTFTISNGGVYGSLLSTPILNPPQSAILGLHAIQKRPVVHNDTLVIRPMMYVALSYDHRLIDGKEAVSALKHIKLYMENPGDQLLLDL